MDVQTPDSGVKKWFLRKWRGQEKDKLRKVGIGVSFITLLFLTGITVNQFLPSSSVHQGWCDSGTRYEILTESFRDSSKKAENGDRKEGSGIGDVKGDDFSYFDDFFSQIVFTLCAISTQVAIIMIMN